jgi:hypothetical protein
MKTQRKKSEIARLTAILESQGYTIVSLQYEDAARPDRFLPDLTGCILIKVVPDDKPVSQFIS